MPRILRILLMVLLSAAPAPAASPVKARTPSGTGILFISQLRPQLSIFKEPGLGRISAVSAGRLPPLSPSVSSPEGVFPVIVTAKKSGWFRIVYDEGEREGWIEGHSSYQFHRWEELLRNRPVALIGGLRKEFYPLRKEPALSAELLESLGKGSRVTSLRMDGDWIRVSTDSREGWIRWRDENSRLVIAVNL